MPDEPPNKCQNSYISKLVPASKTLRGLANFSHAYYGHLRNDDCLLILEVNCRV